MTITNQQRHLRQHYLCASDSPVILGMSPYKRTPGDIYYSKVLDLPDEEPTEAQTTGNLLEEPLLTWAAEQLGVSILRNPWRVAQEGPGAGVFAAHPDAIVRDRPEGIETKYANAAMGQGYGDEGTDAIPDHVIVQANHQMYAARLEKVWVPVAIAGFSLDFRLFCVPRDETLIDMIVARGMEWWRTYVVPRIPPEGEETPPLEILKHIHREPESVVDLSDNPDIEQLVLEWQQAGLHRKEKENEYEDLKAQILHLLGNAEGALLPDGRILTFLEQNFARQCDLDTLRLEHPDLYEKYVIQPRGRVLRVKQPKRVKFDMS